MFLLLVTYFITYFPFLSLLADSIGYDKKIQTHLGIASSAFIIPAWIALFILNIKKNKILTNKKYSFGLTLLFFFFSILTVIISVWAYFSPQNYVYSITRLHQEQLGLICLYLGITLLITKPFNWWQKHYQKVLLYAPFVMAIGFLIICLWPFNYVKEIVKEDHLIENLEFWVLFLGSMLIIFKTIKTKKTRPIFLNLFFIFLALILFFLAGEEISWGQRVFNLTTPEKLAQINRQNEITLHNINAVQGVTENLYALIGVSCGLLWLIPKKYTKKHWWTEIFIPRSYLFGFFLMPGIYYCYPLYSGSNLIIDWAEFFELLLYIGIVIHCLNIYKISKK